MFIVKNNKIALIIAKNPKKQEKIADILRFEGFATVFARDRNSALELARERCPHLIICDLSTPAFDARDFLIRLRQDSATEMVPVILLVAQTDGFNWRRAMAMGADDYLLEPLNGEELKEAIAIQLKKQAARERHLQKELERLRDLITSVLPHELRTPLTGIMTSSEFLIGELESLEDSVIRDVVKCIQFSGQRLQRLIQNFLLYSELEQIVSDPIQMEAVRSSETTSAVAVIEGVALNLSLQAKRQQDLELKLEDASVRIESKNLSKILEEVIDNACKFSSPGTPIEIATAIEDENYIISIGNCGRGMTAEQIDRIGPYVQFDRQVYEQQGTGLGLVIARRLAELHQGKLLVTSIPRKQTTVKISLPRTHSLVLVPEKTAMSRASYANASLNRNNKY